MIWYDVCFRWQIREEGSKGRRKVGRSRGRKRQVKKEGRKEGGERRQSETHIHTNMQAHMHFLSLPHTPANAHKQTANNKQNKTTQ